MQLLLFAETIQLFPDGTLFVHIAIILAMIWLLNRTLYRPINRILEAREKSKGGHSGEAAKILEDAAGKEQQYATAMLDTRSEGYSLIETEQKAASDARNKQIGEVKAEVAGKLDAGRADIQKQAGEARAMIAADAEKMADRIAANILKA